MTNGQLFLEEILKDFKSLKKTCERAAEQLSDEEYHTSIDSESNSIYIQMKHIGGNLKSRWTDFLTTDGEKPDRKRDGEFEDDKDLTKLRQLWETGWNAVLNTLSSLTEEDLQKTVYIRAEPLNVTKAIIRSASHAAYHTGQIVYLAKHIKGSEWKTLSVPRGKSEELNKQMMGK